MAAKVFEIGSRDGQSLESNPRQEIPWPKLRKNKKQENPKTLKPKTLNSGKKSTHR